jgi:hypothetical protein
MKVLLTTLNAKYIHINLAVRLLYELNRDKEGLQWKEFAIKESKDEIAEFCSGFDLVAFSCYIWNITPTLEVARKLKALKPEVKILLGGPEVSYDWQNVIDRPEVDYIITGEGEIPFKSFLDNYPQIEMVSNLVYKTEVGVNYLPKQVQIDLNEFKDIMPYRNDKPEELYNKVCYIETSRGCPYKCEFCLASLDNKVRYLPDEAIKANLLYLMEHGRVIKFLERTFNIKKQFTIDIFKFILEHHRPENVFQFEITADILHPDIIQFIHDHVPHGLFRFEIGIQTVNQKANLEVSRKQNFQKTKQIIESLKDKVEMHLDLIVGLPLDRWEDIKFSFEEVFKLFPPELQLGFLKFLKGTPVREKYAQYGFVFDPEPPYQIIESDFLSREELKRIENLEEALEIYWNKKRAVRTLKYVTANYSIFDFLLGLSEQFALTSDFHKHTLTDVYEILYQYGKKNYPEDSILHQLIAVDYFLEFKIKPKLLFIEEAGQGEKQRLLDALRFNHHKFRSIVLPLGFNLEAYLANGIIEKGKFLQVIQYNGTEKPQLLHEPAGNFNIIE